MTLKAVRTGGDLMTTLRAKLVGDVRAHPEGDDRDRRRAGAAHAARVKFQNQLVDLRIGDATVKSVTQR